MQGLSGTYAVNDTDFSLPPTSGKWVVRKDYGMDGGGHPIYAQNRRFELDWDYVDAAQSNQIIGFYNQVGSTGTATVCLPEYGQSDYRFKNYSGCTMTEPEFGEYHVGYQPMKITILNVNTNQ